MEVMVPYVDKIIPMILWGEMEECLSTLNVRFIQGLVPKKTFIDEWPEFIHCKDIMSKGQVNVFVCSILIIGYCFANYSIKYL